MNPASNLKDGAGAIDVLRALRAATGERHQRVDCCMPLSRPDPTHADYIDHLRLMRAWLRPLESWLGGARIFGTALIDADLADAGVKPEHEPDLLCAERWPAHASASYRWGARYVVEGSRLGSAVLFNRLRTALRPHKLRYLKGGDGVCNNRWPEFLHALRTSVQTPLEIAEASEGACDAFDAVLALAQERA